MSFTEIVTAGIDRIYEEDLDSQKHWLSTICRFIRGRDEITPLLEAKAFVVPNNNYMIEKFGPKCQDPKMDMYSWDGTCIWDNFLVMPIPNVAGDFIGFVGFDPLVKANERDGVTLVGHSKYRYSNSNVFTRGRYVYFLRGVYEKAIRDGYVVLSDGNFDMLYMHHEGINAGSMLGSLVTEQILFQLSFIEHIFVVEDGDVAGRELFEKLSSGRKNVHSIRQNVRGDADDVLKSVYRERYVELIRNAIREKRSAAMRLKPWKVEA